MGFFKSSRTSGFTLAELLVVLSILALLLAVVIAKLGEGRKKAHDTERTTEIAQVQLGLRLYKDAHGGYPSYDNGEQIGGGGSFDTDIAPYVAGTVADPRSGVTGYEYYYDSDYDSCGGTDRRILIALTMERSAAANYATVCGGSSENLGNGVTPTEDSYVIILR